MPNKIEIHGHRGCRGLMPENSIPAFLKAIDLRVDVLELDVVVNGEGQLVVSHEPWMNSVICQADGFGPLKEKAHHNIYKLTQQQIEQYDCGSKGHKDYPNQERIKVTKPLLRDLVKAVRSYTPGTADSLKYNIEIKYHSDWENTYCPDRGEFLDIFIHEIQTLKIEDQVLMQCFDRKLLQLAKTKNVSFPLVFLVKNLKGIQKNIDQLGFVPSYYSPYHKLVTKKTMKKAVGMGTKVVPWTVNKRRDIKRAIDLGVHGIISDYPNRVRELYYLND